MLFKLIKTLAVITIIATASTWAQSPEGGGIRAGAQTQLKNNVIMSIETPPSTLTGKLLNSSVISSEETLPMRSNLMGLQGINSIFTVCSPWTLDVFGSLGDALIPSCWDNKQSWNRQSDKSVINDKELLESDYRICSCLRNPVSNKNASIRALMDVTTATLPNYNPNTDVLDVFKVNADRLQKEMRKDRDSLAFQASIISNGDKEFTDVYATSASAHFKDALSTEAGENAVAANGNKGIFQGKNKKQQNENIRTGVKTILENFEIPHRIDPALFVEPQLAEGQCVGGREFLAFKQLPDDDKFLKEIVTTSEENFDPMKWNYDSLKARYDLLMAKRPDQKQKYKDEILSLKGKLRFLHKNPMIKTFFNTDLETGYVDRVAKMSDERKNFIREKTQAHGEKLDSRKKELFSILKEAFSPDRNCKDLPTSCLRASLAPDKINKYKEALQGFFVQPDVGDMMDIESEKDAYRKLIRLSDVKNFSPREPILSQKAVEINFMHSTGLASPDSCVKDHVSEVNIAQCVEIYSAYCKTLDDVIPKLWALNDTDPELSDDLEVEGLNDFNPTLANNSELARFNHDICVAPRRASLNSKKTMTFGAFQKSYCKNSSAPECKSESLANIAIIREKFLKEYPHPGGESNETSELQARSFLAFNQSGQIQDHPGGIPPGIKLSDSGSSRNQALASTKDRWGVADTGTSSNSLQGLDRPSQEMNRAALGGPSESLVNYANLAKSLPEQKIEDMSNSQRAELLDGWKKDYENYQKNNAGSQNTAQSSAAEKAMQERITALESLLDHQKKLTDDQYRLLNDALASQKNNSAPSGVTKNVVSNEQQDSSARKKSSAIMGADPISSDEINRAPASINSQFDTSASGTGKSLAHSRNSARSASKAASDSSGRDSVAREEAKLVNLRQNPNGSITIEALSGKNSASANAINVTISDDLYRLAQLNPTGLNLSQIAKNISKEQIAQLEGQGVITLLLQNGSNPPLEVKVRKQNNKLVQVENTEVIARRVSLEGLKNTLKQ
jgi:hypothetical protein